MKSNSNNGNSSPYLHRVFAQPMQIENTAFALDQGEQLLNAHSKYLNVQYTLPKMDQAAIPYLPFLGGIYLLCNENQLCSNNRF